MPQHAAPHPANQSHGPLGVRAMKVVAADHGVDPITVWRWAKGGWLEIIRIANRPYVTLASLETFHQRALAGELGRPPSGAAKRSSEARIARQAEELRPKQTEQ